MISQCPRQRAAEAALKGESTERGVRGLTRAPCTLISTGLAHLQRRSCFIFSDNIEVSYAAVTAQFTDAMRAAGLLTDAIITADGVLHRFHVEGDKSRTRNGWYVLHGDGIPAGCFGNWKGICVTWRADIGRKLNADEERHHRERMAAIKLQREQETKSRHKEASDKASALWQRASPANPAHRYLVKKSVRAYGIRQLDNHLLIPLRDTSGCLHGLQFIGSDGAKMFGTGTAKAGHYHSIGNAPNEVLAICEGYATGASIHAATRWPVVIAFDAGNLRPVSQALRNKYPSITLLICADNDRNNPDNPGLNKGREAARSVGGIVIAPAFAASSTGTDWNDHASEYGMEATRAQLLGVLAEISHVA